MGLLPKKGTRGLCDLIALLGRQSGPPRIKAHPRTAIHHTTIRRRVIAVTTIPIVQYVLCVGMHPVPKRRGKHEAIHDLDVAPEFLLVLRGRDAAPGVG